MKILYACSFLFLFSCTKTVQVPLQNQAQDWNIVEIEEPIKTLAAQDQLIFSLESKPDGQYCTVRYEGAEKKSSELTGLTQRLSDLGDRLQSLLVNKYSALATLSELQPKPSKELENLYLEKGKLLCLSKLVTRIKSKYLYQLDQENAKRMVFAK